MSNVVINKETRINPKDPKSHPDHKAAQKLGAEKFKTMTFKSEGEKRDYVRQVESNPNNVLGLPAFYPPQKTSTSGGLGLEHDCKASGHRWSNTIDKFCTYCFEDKPTEGKTL